jgi:RNA-binding protein
LQTAFPNPLERRDNGCVLTTRERAHLKARAHALEPTVHIGHGGVTDAVIGEIDRALTVHELIKIRAATADRETRRSWFATICARTNAAAVQSVGKVMVLWRPRPDADAVL